MQSNSLVPLKETDWLETLFQPATRIGIDFGGYDSRFAPEPGWDMGLRKIDEHLVYFVAENGCSAVLEGKRFRLGAGSLCWICPTTPFRFFCGRHDSPTIYRFRFSVKKSDRLMRPAWSYRYLPEAWRMLDTVKQIALGAERPGRFGPWRTRTLLSLLSIQVFETAPSRKRGGPFLDDVQRARIAALLSENTVVRPTPPQLARLLDYSPSYFTRIFRRSYGLPPRTWLLQQRLRHAAVLLRESSSRVSDIAYKLGYTEVYLFSRQFRQLFGTSPKQWRRRSA